MNIHWRLRRILSFGVYTRQSTERVATAIKPTKMGFGRNRIFRPRDNAVVRCSKSVKRGVRFPSRHLASKQLIRFDRQNVYRLFYLTRKTVNVRAANCGLLKTRASFKLVNRRGETLQRTFVLAVVY